MRTLKPVIIISILTLISVMVLPVLLFLGAYYYNNTLS